MGTHPDYNRLGYAYSPGYRPPQSYPQQYQQPYSPQQPNCPQAYFQQPNVPSQQPYPPQAFTSPQYPQQSPSYPSEIYSACPLPPNVAAKFVPKKPPVNAKEVLESLDAGVAADEVEKMSRLVDQINGSTEITSDDIQSGNTDIEKIIRAMDYTCAMLVNVKAWIPNGRESHISAMQKGADQIANACRTYQKYMKKLLVS